MINNNTILKLEHLQKVYENGFQAIFDLELEIQKGEFVVFVGPSGCGKTTTIRMIAGLEKVSGGKILLKNRDSTDLSPRKRNISMVFQNYALFPHLSVKENIIFTLKTKKVSREIIEKKLKWAAEVLKLKYVLNRKPAQLSGGQRQRVALGRAIVAEPTLFLMDEPLSNLDAKLRGTMRSVIRKLHDDLGTTSIYVTHDQIEAMTMADKIVVMSDGFIQQMGTPIDIFLEPSNLFVASFIGTPSINLIDGEIEKGNFKFSYNDKKFQINVKEKKFYRKPTSNNIVLGIRPQYIDRKKNKTNKSIEYTVEYIEILGSEAIVFTNNGFQYISNIENIPTVGQKIHLEFQLNKIMFFDKNTEVSLTSEINEVNLQYIKIFLASKDAIKKRTAIMNKEKNKNMNSTLYEKIKTSIFNWIYPSSVLLNPFLFELKKDKRKINNLINDSQRRKQVEETKKLIEQRKEIILNIRNGIKEIKSLSPYLKEFNKNRSKILKIMDLFETDSKIKINLNIKKEFFGIEKNMNKNLENFNTKNIWDKDELKNFNDKCGKFFGDKKNMQIVDNFSKESKK